MNSVFSMLAVAVSLLTVGQLDQKKADEMFKENNSFTAKVVAVPQGDTVSVELDNESISIRLAETDSPEPRQPFARQAREFTEGLALGQTVKVTVKFVDVNKRVVGDVFLKDGRMLNHEVVRWGYAWHYRVTPTPSKIMEQLEFQAWKKHLGLWVDEHPVPPWNFRADATSPPPPFSPTKVDYDRIFEYGIFGEYKNRTYSWPACIGYRIPPKSERLIFSSKLEAEAQGYRTHPKCPKN